MIVINTQSLDQIYVEVFRRLIDGTPDGSIDIQIRPSVFSYNNLYVAKSCRHDFDLGLVGLTPTRWPRLINDYVDRNKLAHWFPKIKKLGRGRELLFPFNEVKPVVKKKMSNYNYGACLLGVTFRLYPPKLTLFSRATNWSQIGALDLALAHAFAWHCADYMGNITTDEIEFAWLNSNTYLMAITCIPWLVTHGRFLDVIKGDYLISKDLRNLLKYYSEVENPAYSPIKRIRKRVAYILDGNHQEVPVESFRLFNSREWEMIKDGEISPEKDFGKLRGGYAKTQRHQPGPLFKANTYDLVREVKKRASRFSYKQEVLDEQNFFRFPNGHQRNSKRSLRTERGDKLVKVAG